MNEVKLMDNDHCILLYKLDPTLPEIMSSPQIIQPKPVEEPVSPDQLPELSQQQLSGDDEGEEYDEGEFPNDVTEEQGDLESLVALLQGIQQDVEAEAVANNNNPPLAQPSETTTVPGPDNTSEAIINQPPPPSDQDLPRAAASPDAVVTSPPIISGPPETGDQITVPLQQHNTPPQQDNLPAQAFRINFSQLLRIIPFPSDLQTLISIGFPEWRCRKALLLNYFDPDAALEWLLNNANNPHADDPFSEEEAAQIIGDLHNLRYETEEPHPNIEEQIAECVKKNKCTFIVTKREFAAQKWYYCYSCGLVDSEGVCESCAAVCHKNHKLSAIKSSKKFYCDCGAGAYSCKCNTE